MTILVAMQENVLRLPFFFYPILLLFCSCQVLESLEIVPGVSEELAAYRKTTISDIQYDLFFNIPEKSADPIPAQLNVVFNLNTKPLHPLIIDFNVDKAEGLQVKQDNDSIPFDHRFEHIIIDKAYLKVGKNKFSIQFMAGELSLNRNTEYLYTLFVPDRASTVFPCFDQPDLKARFTLRLEVPEKWKAVSNYSLRDSRILDGRKRLSFNETAPIPTYLFAFAVGKFREASSSSSGIGMTMYYRETDSLKVESNLKEIFNLHEKAIDWMEEYTGIEYPFEKFDFVLIPTFQYGGMEHPGSIFYRERSLFLDEAATLNDKLGRASLISHETAHIWFGDLVTMRWFNDVWSKEVFANFMADKIVNPSFTEIDHNLKFFLQHFPSAYSVDRTLGANAIRQPLDNLKNAGLMYGPIIYNKAPVMMKHLETLTGPKAFQNGMQEYLSTYAFGNASWNDLIKILDSKTDSDLTSWSKIWVEQPGMPRYWVDQTDRGLSVSQEDPLGLGRVWMQHFTVLTSGKEYEIYFDTPEHTLDEMQDLDYILLNGKGLEYGSFVLDDKSIAYFLSSEGRMEDSFLRGRIWLDLYESFLAAKISPKMYVEALLDAIEIESDPQILNQLLGQLRTIFWKFLDQSDRNILSERVESTLFNQMLERKDLGIRMSCYQAYSNIFLTESAMGNLMTVLKKQEGFMGIPLSPSDYTALSMQLAVRTEDIEEFNQMMQQQLGRLKNPDMIDRLKFIIPALSPEEEIRDRFFESLLEPKNREQEPWVISALYYLHHPLRQESALKYLNPSLDVIGEIQRTGDIFFPGRWLDATFGGHQSEEALNDVEDFMGSSKALELDQKLQLKVWVASDLLRRSVEMQNFDSKELQ